MWLFLAFLMVPLIEIALFIQVGGIIGLWPTLGIVIATAIAGTYLVRSQGFRVLGEVRGSFESLNDPTEPLAHGAMILFSGALLLTPGFFTDAVGFALLVPGVRGAVFRWARTRINIQTMGQGPESAGPGARRGPHRPDIIETEYHEVDPEQTSRETPGAQGPSGWTKH